MLDDPIEPPERTAEEFWQLLEPLYPRVRAFARHQLPGQWEDLLQEGVARALESFGTLRDVDRFRPWLFRVIAREATRMRRRDFWRRFLPLPQIDEEGDGVPDAPDPASHREHHDRLLSMRLAASLQRLSWERRQTVLLYYVAGFRLEEIAEMRGESLSAAKSRLSRARQELRERIDMPLTPSAPESGDRHDTEEACHAMETWLVAHDDDTT